MRADPDGGDRPFDPDLAYKTIVDALSRIGVDSVRIDSELASDAQALAELILDADVILAHLVPDDLDVPYVLGLSHGLRPSPTIVVSSSTDVPFDLRDQRVIVYQDSGSGIDEPELAQLRSELTKAVTLALAGDDAGGGSPVYQSVPGLRPPSGPVADALTRPLWNEAEAAFASADWEAATEILTFLLTDLLPDEPSVTRRLAEAHLNTGRVDEAIELLAPLIDDGEDHPATLAVWAEGHRRRYLSNGNGADLDEAIRGLRTVFEVQADLASGTGAALLLMVRSVASTGDDSRRDWREARALYETVRSTATALVDQSGDDYRPLASLWEAAIALGDDEATKRWQVAAVEAAPDDGALENTAQRIEQLEALIGDAPDGADDA